MTRKTLMGMEKEMPVMMTWMEMVGLSCFVLCWGLICPFALFSVRSRNRITDMDSLHRGCPGVTCFCGRRLCSPLPYLTPCVSELYAIARNFAGISSSSVLSGLCLYGTSVFQIIPSTTPTILFIHDNPRNGELKERAMSRVTGISP